MSEVAALFWDVGGVFLSNGWDAAERGLAASRFDLESDEFERRHEAFFVAVEEGRMTLDAYLDQAVFYRPRAFTREEFTSFMFGLSKENKEVRAILDEVTAANRYFQATLNNEGLELNNYRIRKFDLARNLSAFFSSCYLGLRKPDEAIYRQALNITQRAPEDCVFIDDRLPNVEGARRVGMRAIHFLSAAQLRAELEQNGVAVTRS
jgi:putative hydrolase of the HAD superfamily